MMRCKNCGKEINPDTDDYVKIIFELYPWIEDSHVEPVCFDCYVDIYHSMIKNQLERRHNGKGSNS